VDVERIEGLFSRILSFELSDDERRRIGWKLEFERLLPFDELDRAEGEDNQDGNEDCIWE